MAVSCSDQRPSSSPRPRRRFSGPWPWRRTGRIYVGSGNEGKVFKIDSAGKIATFFDTTELEVHALALAPDGSLYAATSPDGRIYKIDRSGKGAPFFDPEDKYIWSLALDGQGNVYAGTGEKGLIYKITPDGKGSAVLRDEGHPRHRAHVRARRPAAGRHRRAWTIVPRRSHRARRSSCSIRRIQEIRAIRLDPQGNIYRRRVERAHQLDQPAAGVAAIGARASRPRASPSRQSRPK